MFRLNKIMIIKYIYFKVYVYYCISILIKCIDYNKRYICIWYNLFEIYFLKKMLMKNIELKCYLKDIVLYVFKNRI